jgi:hypothetical protein
MRKIHIVLVLATLLAAQPIFADDTDSKPCAAIADACSKAGFDKTTEHKKFWKKCMKPVILGQTVQGVTVDPAVVKACRANKMNKMQKELKEMQGAS